MRTAVVFKWARDPQDARINMDDELVWGNAKLSPSADDPAVINVAHAISPEEDIVAITIGDGDNAWAATRGAASTFIVEDAADCLDASRTASLLAGAISEAGGADVVIIGDSEWNKGVPVALMALMNYKAFAGVTSVEQAGDSFRVHCKNGPITKVIEAKPPFLLSVRGLTTEKAAPSMKQVLAARKKPQTKLSSESLPKVRDVHVVEGSASLPESGTVTMIDASDVGEAARKLVEILKSENIL